jgi:very-short-patch-repair endonuclease
MKKPFTYNKPSLKEVRRRLRSNGTSAEAVLWTYLKNKQLSGRRFRRQYSVGNYILDFYCPSERLAIELDGAQHATVSGRHADGDRDAYLLDFGIRVLRFENNIVFNHIEQVLFEIEKMFVE